MPKYPGGDVVTDLASDDEEVVTVDYRMTDLVSVSMIRLDVAVLAGLLHRQIDRELAIQAKHPAPTVDAAERAEWRTAQKQRLYEQLRAVAGPIYDPEHARKKQAERNARPLPPAPPPESIPWRRLDGANGSTVIAQATYDG